MLLKPSPLCIIPSRATSPSLDPASRILPAKFNTGSGTLFLVGADGRFYPSGGRPAASVYVIDERGKKITNDADIAWESLMSPALDVQHSYSCIGLLHLPRNTSVTVHLVGTVLQLRHSHGSFNVGANSNLFVLAVPEGTAVSSYLSQDTPAMQFRVENTTGGKGALPTKPLLTLPVSGQGTPVIALGAGRSYLGAQAGDAMWLYYRDNLHDQVRNNNTLHVDNDMWCGAECGSAPMFTHAFFESAQSVTLAASAERWPFCCNDVSYRVGARLTSVVLSGLHVMGSFSHNDRLNVPNTFQCIAIAEPSVEHHGGL